MTEKDGKILLEDRSEAQKTSRDFKFQLGINGITIPLKKKLGNSLLATDCRLTTVLLV